MVFSKVTTFYINSNTDKRVIRYDVIKINNETYQVKVIDDQQHGISHPNLLVQLDSFEITKEKYNRKYRIGDRTFVRTEHPPTFEGSIEHILQEHRNKIS